MYRLFMEDMNVYYSRFMTVHIHTEIKLCFITKENIAQYRGSFFSDEYARPLTAT
jgi:hypothetical protein